MKEAPKSVSLENMKLRIIDGKNADDLAVLSYVLVVPV